VEHNERRSDGINAVYSEMETLSRRAVARTRRMSAPLSFVEHSLLTFIGTTPGCRATDIAADFQLNRSTISRQLNTLGELGLVEYAPQEDDAGRGRVLRLTERGRQLRERSVEAQRNVVTSRLQEWSEEDIAAFAAALARFNAGPED
jgi:DNA-binding MarR family transcriptional regulator